MATRAAVVTAAQVIRRSVARAARRTEPGADLRLSDLVRASGQPEALIRYHLAKLGYLKSGRGLYRRAS